MATDPAIFDELIGQEQASHFLSAIIRQRLSSHAYLFAGPAGVGKLTAAMKLAAALCCEDNGCGVCAGCLKAAEGTHPDIQPVSPTGAFVTVDQIRELNRGLSLRPSESRARVFILTDAEAFNAESANAFLKSLEEPPPFVYFILLATGEDRLLSTLVSRCQPVRFSPVPADSIETFLKQNCSVRPAEARAFARFSGGNLERAISLCRDPQLAARRQSYLEIGKNLCSGGWEGGAAQMAAEIGSAVHEAAAEAGQTAPGSDIPEGFITLPKKRLEEDARRRAAAAQRRELDFALTVLESWFRDMIVVAAGATETVLNSDYELELEDRALPTKLGSYQQALAAIRATRDKLGYNIDLELALQAMFFNLQEVL